MPNNPLTGSDSAGVQSLSMLSDYQIEVEGIWIRTAKRGGDLFVGPDEQGTGCIPANDFEISIRMLWSWRADPEIPISVGTRHPINRPCVLLFHRRNCRKNRPDELWSFRDK